jgi:hypothetical protein
MSGDARDFSNFESRAVIKICNSDLYNIYTLYIFSIRYCGVKPTFTQLYCTHSAGWDKSILIFFPARQSAERNSRHSDRNNGVTCTIVCHCQKLGVNVKRGDFFTCGAPRLGRHKTVSTPEIINQIQELILEDRRISAKSIGEQVGISREWVGSIIHENLDMRKLSTKWVSKCLNADKKRQRCQSSEQLLGFFFGAIQMIFCRAQLVTMDETWL